MTTGTMHLREDRRAADWLCLAAAPAFAVMALFSAMSSARPEGICGLMHGPSPLSGMTCMYLLMSAVHSTHWLNLLGARERRA